MTANDIVIDISDTLGVDTGTAFADLADSVVAMWRKESGVYIKSIAHGSIDRTSQEYEQLTVTIQPHVYRASLEAALRTQAQTVISNRVLQARR